jgi:two-component system, OmpR family, response regulator
LADNADAPARTMNRCGTGASALSHADGSGPGTSVLSYSTRQAGSASHAADGPAARDLGTSRLQAGDLELDGSRWTVHRAGTPIELSPTEFRLLSYLMSHQGRMLSREQIAQNVWGPSRRIQIVDTYVSYLRRKLDALGPPLIHSQRGVGYGLRSGPVPPAGQRAAG